MTCVSRRYRVRLTAASHKPCGTIPTSLLFPLNVALCKLVHFNMADGNDPANLLKLTSKCVKAVHEPIDSGKDPLKLLPMTEKDSKFVQLPIDVGSVPLNPTKSALKVTKLVHCVPTHAGSVPTVVSNQLVY